MLKLPLHPGKPYPDPYRHSIMPWASCAPFIENSRGVLIHRPKSAKNITILGKTHAAILYWCGNGVAGKHLTLLEAPPEDALLCEACERRAVAAGLPSASSLAGRHVHLGKVVAVRTCCEGARSEH